MKVTIQKLGITIEDDEDDRQQKHYSRAASMSAVPGTPISGCSKGYAIYAFRGTRKLHRIGGATCAFPSSPYSASTAHPYTMISSGLSTTLSGVMNSNNSRLKELRFAICCPVASTLGEKAAKMQQSSGGSSSR